MHVAIPVCSDTRVQGYHTSGDTRVVTPYTCCHIHQVYRRRIRFYGALEHSVLRRVCVHRRRRIRFYRSAAYRRRRGSTNALLLTTQVCHTCVWQHKGVWEHRLSPHNTSVLANTVLSHGTCVSEQTVFRTCLWEHRLWDWCLRTPSCVYTIAARRVCTNGPMRRMGPCVYTKGSMRLYGRRIRPSIRQTQTGLH